MADAAPDDAPSYDLVVHRAARDELRGAETGGAAIRPVLDAAARRAEPSSHPKIEAVVGYDGLLKARVGDWRAILELAKPELRVLLVGKRRTVYRRLATAADRAGGDP